MATPCLPDVLDAALARARAASEALPGAAELFRGHDGRWRSTCSAWRRVDVAVLEVGLGGRLDATNVVTPVAVAITAIDLDHSEHLGPTIAAIAREKAGVIKAGGLAVLARNPPDARAVVEQVAREAGATLICAPDGTRVDFDDGVRIRAARRSRLPARATARCGSACAGRHQLENAVVAVRLLEADRRTRRAPRTGRGRGGGTVRGRLAGPSGADAGGPRATSSSTAPTIRPAREPWRRTSARPTGVRCPSCWR